MELKEKKEKLIKKLHEDDRNLSWFWKNHIKGSCGIMYSTFMNQLSGTWNLGSNVDKAIENFMGEL